MVLPRVSKMLDVDLPVENSTSAMEVMGSGSSIQGVACTATLQSLHVPISVSLAATCWPRNRTNSPTFYTSFCLLGVSSYYTVVVAFSFHFNEHFFFVECFLGKMAQTFFFNLNLANSINIMILILIIIIIIYALWISC